MSILLLFHLLLLPFSPSDKPISKEHQEIYTFSIRDTPTSRVFATKYLKFLEDPSNELNFDEVQERLSEFKAFNSQVLNHRYSYWSVIKLRNDSDKGQNFAMMLGYNSMVEGYEVDNNGNVTIRKSGYLMSIPERDMLHDGDAKVKLFLNKGEEKTIWIRTRQLDHFKPFIEVSLIPYDIWDRHTDREDLFEGVFTGILVILAILSLIFYSYTKERFFLYYGIYALLHGVYFFSFYGYINIYFFPEAPLFTQPLWLFPILTFAMYFAFARNFLKVKDFMPSWYRLFKILTPILLGLFIIASIFLWTTHNLRDGIWFKNLITLVCSLIGLSFIFSLIKTSRVWKKFHAFS